MSFERGWNALHLSMPEKIPHTQYISHDEFTLNKTGINTREPEQQFLAWPALARALDFDFIWNTCEMPVQGRMTRLGHAEWSNTDEMDTVTDCPFVAIDDVLTFDPVREYGIHDLESTVEYFTKHLNDQKQRYPEAVVSGGRYNTLFSACIRTFGWEMFLSSVPHNEEKFNKILEGFFELSMAEVRAWLKTDLSVYLCHDDIAWTSGAVFHPDWYRKYIFPKYKRLWKPLKDRGIIVLYCADGNFTEFVDDIAEAGADGFIFEPLTSLEYIVNNYGKSKIIIGNADCRILQFGTRESIKKELYRCIDAGKSCAGYFMAVGNHIPNGIPFENIDYFFELFEKQRNR
ncbi:MAG: hypothetical protein JXB48_20300 [Candidatus Latescibacteria bacterium]|nr:hypothetical protein [Candidatus Latescibacterota bacterium]